MLVWICIFACASVRSFLTAQHVMTGQPRAVPVNSTEVVTAARFAVLEFNRANAEDQFAYKIINITSAKIQVKLNPRVTLNVIYDYIKLPVINVLKCIL